MQERQHITNKSNNNPSISREKSILSRTAITQIKTDYNKPRTQQDIESQQYQQDRFEATKLEIQAKYGSITPLGQERLTFLQAKKAEFCQRYLGNTRRNSRDFSMIPVHRKEVSSIQPIQPKLTIGAPGDKYEQEADRVASLVVNQINAPAAQQSNQNLQREEMSEEELQMKPTLQLHANDGGVAAKAELETSIQQAQSGGQSLADNVRQPMERAFGADFSRVKVHTDTLSDQLNQSIQARAFTTGQDVFFRQGEYNPGSRGGQELIAHELTHVVQQNGRAEELQSNRDKISTSVGTIPQQLNHHYLQMGPITSTLPVVKKYAQYQMTNQVLRQIKDKLVEGTILTHSTRINPENINELSEPTSRGELTQRGTQTPGVHFLRKYKNMDYGLYTIFVKAEDVKASKVTGRAEEWATYKPVPKEKWLGWIKAAQYKEVEQETIEAEQAK